MIDCILRIVILKYNFYAALKFYGKQYAASDAEKRTAFLPFMSAQVKCLLLGGSVAVSRFSFFTGFSVGVVLSLVCSAWCLPCLSQTIKTSVFCSSWPLFSLPISPDHTTESFCALALLPCDLTFSVPLSECSSIVSPSATFTVLVYWKCSHTFPPRIHSSPPFSLQLRPGGS